MLDGFFSESVLLQSQQPKWLTARCGVCKLHKRCQTPKMPVYGEGRRGIMLVGFMPSDEEDEAGKPLVNESGMLLKRQLDGLGIDAYRDCWITYAAICHRGDRKIKKDAVVDYCRPNLLNAVRECDPTVIILFGHEACRSLLVELWNDSVGKLDVWVGWTIPSQDLNAWVCPIWHPSDLIKFSKDQALSVWFRRYLKAAISKAGERPWSEVPDYEKEIRIIYDDEKASRILDSFLERGHPICFDYETNTLKPDSDHARIVSCAVCSNGDRTIAFPWTNRTSAAMASLLFSDLPKIGANIKFEERWTRRILGRYVRNWRWDVMQAAHAIDNREGITGLKFQVFVNFGYGKYSTHLNRFFETANANEMNRIKEIDLKDLLLYNGLDAYLEYKLALKQMELIR